MKTWRECADAGMTVTQAARHLGKDESSGRKYAKAHGFEFVKGNPGPAKLWRKGERKPIPVLQCLSAKERDDYDFLMKVYRYKRGEALRAIGRSELVQP